MGSRRRGACPENSVFWNHSDSAKHAVASEWRKPRRSGVTYRCQIYTSGSDESVLIDVEKSSYASLPYWMRHRAYEGALRVGVIAEGPETHQPRRITGIGATTTNACSVPCRWVGCARWPRSAGFSEQVLRSLALTRSEGASDYRRKGVCECHRTGILNRGFRWARAARRWVHLTRDDHAHRAMYQARAQ